MSTVWDRTAEFIGDNLASLAPIVLLGLFVPLALMGILMPSMGISGQPGNAVAGALVLVMSLVTAWAGLAVTALAFDPAAGRAQAVRIANHRFPALVGASIAMLLLVALLIAPIGIAFGLSGIDMTAMAAGKPPAAGVNGGALAFAMLYSLVLTPLLVFVYARFFVFVTPIVAMERRGLGVFARSFVLTRGVAWKIVGVMILYLVLSNVAGLAAKAVFGTVFALALDDDGPLSLARVLTQIVSAGVSTLFSVLAVAFIAKLYLAARDAREAIVEAT